MTGTHQEHESNPWTVNIGDHPMRTESKAFRASKAACKKILGTIADGDLPFGPGPWEMHHGGSAWVYDGTRWRMFLARAGVEWSMQWCADPAKIDRLRLDYVSLLDAYPQTRPQLAAIGYKDAPRFDQPIVTAEDVGWYTDSLANACVPISRLDHQGVLPSGAGFHHYPAPIKNADFFKVDSFDLWVTLPDGTHAAVTPLAPPGSGDGRVRVVYARHGTAAGAAVVKAQHEGKALILPADSPEARQAFAQQQSA